MKLEKIARLLTIGARVFGWLCLLTGLLSIASAIVDRSNTVLYTILGLCLLVAGGAFVRVRAISVADIQRIRSLK